MLLEKINKIRNTILRRNYQLQQIVKSVQPERKKLKMIGTYSKNDKQITKLDYSNQLELKIGQVEENQKNTIWHN